MKKIAISVGDLNGIGIELILKNHKKISKLCKPIYCINRKLLAQASRLLNISIAKDFELLETKGDFKIKPGLVDKKSGLYSYNSFLDAISLTKNGSAHAIVTLPINKQSWAKAGISYVGHTDMLRDIFQKDAIMMLGYKKMFVALFTEHIPLKDVSKQIKIKKMVKFFIDFAKSINYKKQKTKIAVLGLNPHCGDDGVMGDEERKIKKAFKKANKILHKDIFIGCVVPDIAFTPDFRKKHKYFIALYHDQGLAPLKALHFDKSINISLNLPIIRTSVDHGTAFDIAYKKNNILSNKSYINAIKFIKSTSIV
jgi:4-hydroxythreonine-4-phosphate dehydrogenase